MSRGTHVPEPPAPGAQADPGSTPEHRLTVQVFPTCPRFTGVARLVQEDAAFGQSASEVQGVSQIGEGVIMVKNGSPVTHH
jgi:hypothetical protein